MRKPPFLAPRFMAGRFRKRTTSMLSFSDHLLGNLRRGLSVMLTRAGLISTQTGREEWLPGLLGASPVIGTIEAPGPGC
jgi:hypothetical protein